MKKGWLFVCCLLTLSLLLGGCKKNTTVTSDDTSSDPVSDTSENGNPSANPEDEESPANWSKFDLDASWAGSDTFLRCSDGGVDIEGDGSGVSYAVGKLSITKAGTYVLSGSLEGQIYIKAEDVEKVHLVFNGFSLTCSDYSPLYCEEADKVSITLADGTENSVTDNGSGYVQGTTSGNGRFAGAIHSKSSLTINGAGSLSVTTSYRHGIVSNKNLRIVSGAITVNAVEDGLKGKKTLSACGGTVRVTAGGDGLKVNEDDDEEKGYLVIEDGNFTVEAGGDGLDVSQLIRITGGTVRVNSVDHALRSMGEVKIGGDAVLELDAYSGKSDSDAKAIKAEGDVTVSGGTIRISRSFEGIESKNASVYITGGHIEINASDDGINAETFIEVSGGYLFVKASGDGLDSNGDLIFSGGTTIVQGPTSNGDGPLDCGDFNSVIRVTGGTLIAYGSAGMAKYPDESASTQYCMGYTVMLQQGKVYSLRDADGNAICTFEARQDAQSLCISSPEMKDGATYTLYEGAVPTGTAENGYYADPTSTGGSESLSFTVSSILSTNAQGGFGGFGGMGGGPGGFGGNPGDPPDGFGGGGFGGNPGDLPGDPPDGNPPR